MSTTYKTRATANANVEINETRGHLLNIALFLVAPFIGLAYVVAMPFVGLTMLAWFAAKALAAKLAALPAPLKLAGMAAAAPVVGLGFILAMPIAGAVGLAYIATEALQKV